MAIRPLLIALCILFLSEPPAFSRGTASNGDPPWNHEHIDRLPPEVRNYIAGICKGPPVAQHEFATYLPSDHRWRINLEYLRCEGLGEYRRGDQCLDVDFIEVGSHFRLARRAYAACGF